jgi:hypothetical protein
MDFKKSYGKVWLRTRASAGSSEYNNKSSGSMKNIGGNFLSNGASISF